MDHNLKPYPAYKDSGVPWLGAVPEHWNITAVKRHYYIQLGKMLQGQPSGPDDKEISYLKAQHVQWFAVRTSDAPRMWASTREVDQFGISTGDLLVCEGGEGGRCGIVKEITGSYIIQNALHRVRPRDQCQNDFLQYVMSSIAAMGWFDAINNKATIAHFTSEKFGSLRVPIPTPDEQSAIVAFLDHIDRRVNRFIRAKRRIITLLNEQKQAIIHRAVTHGLDPDVRLKPSGVEWLGEVPEHWEVLRSKYIYHEVDARSKTGTETHLSMSQKLGLIPSSLVEERRLISESYVGGKLCEQGDLVLNRLKAHLGVFALAPQKGLISPDYTVFRSVRQIANRYFEFVLRTPACRVEFRKRAKGIVQGFWRLYTDDFYDIRLPFPRLDEQHQIVAFLDIELRDLNQAVQRVEREIDLIREYRTRLIADVVTGKLDVRGVDLADYGDELAELDVELADEGDEGDEDMELVDKAEE